MFALSAFLCEMTFILSISQTPVVLSRIDCDQTCQLRFGGTVRRKVILTAPVFFSSFACLFLLWAGRLQMKMIGLGMQATLGTYDRSENNYPISEATKQRPCKAASESKIRVRYLNRRKAWSF